MLARMPDVARHSLDVDVFRRTSIDAAVIDLAAAGDIDLGDFFTFDIERDSELTGLHPGIQCRTVAYLGDKEFERFRVAIVREMIEPAINGTASGTWDPKTLRWERR